MQQQDPSTSEIEEDPAPYAIHSNIPYTVTNHHPRQILDLYIPTHPSPSTSTSTSTSSNHSQPFPLILYVHGGAFKHGDKSSLLIPLRQLLNGYAIAAINYRRSGEALFPAMIHDCKSALRFVKSPAVAKEFNIDPDRVVIWGESAGGHAATFCGTTSTTITTNVSAHGASGSAATDDVTGDGELVWDVGDNLDISSAVAGVVDYYGPTDFLQMDAHLPSEWATHGQAESPESLYLGGQITRDDMRERVKMADPVTYVKQLAKREGGGKGKIPKFFIAHGTGDRIVPEFMSRWLIEALEEAGVEFEYFPVEGADHVFTGISGEQQKVLDERTDAFLKKVFER